MSDQEPGLIHWKKEWHIGHARFDSEHEHLMRLANEVIVALHEGNPRERTGPALEDLMGGATEHFDGEEALMKETSYHRLQDHTALHDRLVRELVRFARDCKGGTISAEDAAKFLVNWLLNHVLSADVYYVPHFEKLGIV